MAASRWPAKPPKPPVGNGTQPRPLRHRGRLNRRGRKAMRRMPVILRGLSAACFTTAKDFAGLAATLRWFKRRAAEIPRRGTIAVGQLRRWQGLPAKPWGAPAAAEGKTFRVDNLNDANGYVHGLYEPPDPATFTSAALDFMESHSVVVEAGAR